MSVLETIVARRRDRILAEYGEMTASRREHLAASGRPGRDFAAALRDRQDVAVIAEVKKASPSAGAIAPGCDAREQALHYERGGAAAISVLTEPEYFGGSFQDLAAVTAAVDVPVLCKDFVVDPVQLYVARSLGADAVLLIVGVLGHMTHDYAAQAEALGLTPLVEVAKPEELPIALGVRSGVIAVNSRDLHTLGVDARRAHEIVRQLGEFDVTVVAASGVKTRADVEAAASAGADAVLVGETLMRSPFPEGVLGELTGVRKGVRQ